MSAITTVPNSAAARRRRARLRHGGRWAVIVLVVFCFVAPLVWMILASFKTVLAITDPAQTFSFEPTFANYVTVWRENNFLPFILNSLIVGVASTAVSLVVAVPAAYGISRGRRSKTSLLVLSARIIPGVGLLIPWYYIFAQIGLVGTYGALILTHMFVSLPLIVWIMMSFFDGLPTELEEAATVDGLSKFGAFLRVALPLSTPGVATAGILAFVFSWNNFLFALVLSSNNTTTLPVAIFRFISYASIDWGALMAASVSITLPVIVIALIAQKYIVSGLTAGATK
jgi:multiple sugar transport system permease protein